MVNIDQVKKLREETGVSVIECKKALQETKGDFEKAKELLRKLGKELASKRSGRKAEQGIIDCYIHPNKKTGVMLDIRCESDFVAKSSDFQKLAHEICLQIAAMNPIFTSEEEIPKDLIEKERNIYAEMAKNSGKPEKIINQMVEGKIKKYKEQVSLLSQPWIRDDQKTIKNLVEEYIGKLGENILIKRIIRFEI